MSCPPRGAVPYFLAVLLLGLGACSAGKFLGTRHVDIPLGEAGVTEVRPQSITVRSTPVRIDSIPLPERVWSAEEMEIDDSEVSFDPANAGSGTADTGNSGVIEVGVLIAGYPAALWSFAIENGEIEAIEPGPMPVPGASSQQGYEPFPFPQWPKLRDLFVKLPEERRPVVADDLEFSIAGDESVPNDAWGDVYRGIYSGLKSRHFELALVVSTEHSLDGTLTIRTLEVTVFDSGQRLMGGTETANR